MFMNNTILSNNKVEFNFPNEFKTNCKCFLTSTYYYDTSSESPSKKPLLRDYRTTATETICLGTLAIFGFGTLASLADYSFKKLETKILGYFIDSYKDQVVGNLIGYVIPYCKLAAGVSVIFIIGIIAIKCLGNRPAQEDVNVNSLKKFSWKIITSIENRADIIDSAISSLLGIRSYSQVNAYQNIDVKFKFLEIARIEIIKIIFQTIALGALSKVLPVNGFFSAMIAVMLPISQMSRLRFLFQILSTFYSALESNQMKVELPEIKNKEKNIDLEKPKAIEENKIEQEIRYNRKKRKGETLFANLPLNTSPFPKVDLRAQFNFPTEKVNIDISIFKTVEIQKENIASLKDRKFEINASEFSIGQKSSIVAEHKYLTARKFKT